jgi:glycosyltransferase involved in cell wall biosynthesis
LRIAIVSNWAPPPRRRIGGAQVYATELARRLAAEHEVVVLSGASELPLPGVRHVSLPHQRYLHPAESDMRKVLWHLRDQWRPSVHRVLKSALLEIRPDVVHTQEPQGLSAAVFTATAATPAAHVHTAHDLNLLCVRTTMTDHGQYCGGRCGRCFVQRNVRARLVARGIDRLIAPSDYMRELHVRRGVVQREAAVTIRQPAREASARERQPNGSELHVGFMGNLSPHKGILTLINAFGYAPAEWRLHIAGDGLLDADVHLAAQADERIVHHGYVTGAEKDRFFDQLDVLVFPSEYEENAPLIAAEAGVRGLPCLVSDRGGLPETPHAWKFHAGDAMGLLEALRRLAADPSAIARASQSLMQSRSDFLWPRHLERVEEVYTDALAAWRRRTAT